MLWVLDICIAMSMPMLHAADCMQAASNRLLYFNSTGILFIHTAILRHDPTHDIVASAGGGLDPAGPGR